MLSKFALTYYPVLPDNGNTKTNKVSKTEENNMSEIVPAMETITDTNLNIQHCEQFIPKELCEILYNEYYTNKRSHKNKRTKFIYGEDTSRKYIINWYNTTSTYDIKQWDGELLLLKNKICEHFNINLSVCIVQIYPNGNVGINKHRDKEMIPGTHIVGVSIGDDRNIQFKYKTKSHTINLTDGSLYILNPPTNNYWTHEINKKPNSTNPRISFTFRDY